jgi:chemotaxis protein MotB
LIRRARATTSMRFKGGVVVMAANRIPVWCVATGLMLAASCSSNDEHLAEKDRQIAELREDRESLQGELNQAKSVQQLTQQQLEDQRRLAADAEAKKKAPPAKAETERPATAGGEAGAKAATPPRNLAVSDSHVESEARSDGSFMFRLKGAATFASGSDQLTKEGKDAVDKIAAELKKTKGSITVEGHSDSSPLTGKNKEMYRDNLNLSLARAVAVRDRLVEHGKIATDRISVAGRGDGKPLAKGNTKDALARNRRVEIVVRDE